MLCPLHLALFIKDLVVGEEVHERHVDEDLDLRSDRTEDPLHTLNLACMRKLKATHH